MTVEREISWMSNRRASQDVIDVFCLRYTFHKDGAEKRWVTTEELRMRKPEWDSEPEFTWVELSPGATLMPIIALSGRSLHEAELRRAAILDLIDGVHKKVVDEIRSGVRGWFGEVHDGIDDTTSSHPLGIEVPT